MWYTFPCSIRFVRRSNSSESWEMNISSKLKSISYFNLDTLLFVIEVFSEFSNSCRAMFQNFLFDCVFLLILLDFLNMRWICLITCSTWTLQRGLVLKMLWGILSWLMSNQTRSTSLGKISHLSASHRCAFYPMLTYVFLQCASSLEIPLHTLVSTHLDSWHFRISYDNCC